MARKAVQASEANHECARHDGFDARVGHCGFKDATGKVVAFAAKYRHKHTAVGDEEVRVTCGQHVATTRAEAICGILVEQFFGNG